MMTIKAENQRLVVTAALSRAIDITNTAYLHALARRPKSALESLKKAAFKLAVARRLLERLSA